MTPRSLVLLVLVAVLATGCLTPAGEQARGDEQAADIEASIGLLDGGAALDYVRAIGVRLAAVSDRPDGPWHFEIADTSTPNAFALPGGHVYLTRGLLTLVNSEDELAGVIGHEMAHVVARHSSKRIGAAVLTAPVTLASGIAGLAAGIVSPLLGSVIAGTGQILSGGLVIAPYSRAQENEADEIGQRLAARAGYAPDGISHFLRTLEREEALLGDATRRFHLFASHPDSAARAVRTAERARSIDVSEAAPIAGSQQAMLAKLDGLLVGLDPARGVFREQQFLHPVLDLALSFPKEWETRNTPAAAGAMHPTGDAAVAIRFVAADRSLDAVVAEAASDSLSFEPGTIRGLPSAHARTTDRGVVADVTLIEYRGDVFAVVGNCAEKVADERLPALTATAQSFRALKESERRSIRESRLRVHRAQAGETAARIVERTGTTWSVEQLAIANAVEQGERLEAGRLVKIAAPEPYSR